MKNLASFSSHSDFPLASDIVHLNHAGIAPWPKRTVEAIQRFATENMTQGSRHYTQWLHTEEALRDQLRQLINAESKYTIALLKNTSEALSVIAYGLDWKRGDNVITFRQEFPSNRIVWESLAPRFGVEVRFADLAKTSSPETAIIELIDANTRLVSVSSIQYASGLRMDLSVIGQYCRSHNVLFCVDAIQSLGVVPFDVQAIGADFVVADGHKWMLGPEGVALFYCNVERQQQLHLNQFGWHMMEHRDDFDRLDWSPAPDARRFECGSPNSMGIHALHASLSLIQEYGVENIFVDVTRNVDYLMDHLTALGVQFITPSDPHRRGGILTFQLTQIDNRYIYKRLLQKGVLCAHRAGGIRLSPHFYTPRAALDKALEILACLLR